MAAIHPDEILINRSNPNQTVVTAPDGSLLGEFEPHFTDIQLRRSWKHHVQALCNGSCESEREENQEDDQPLLREHPAPVTVQTSAHGMVFTEETFEGYPF
ncbi:TPA: hypothetical protein ACGCW7_003496 [Vibrio cholerae O1]|nr:hypothetical protein [Vibrio cholerae]